MDTQKPTRRRLALAAIVLFLTVGVVWWFVGRDGDNDPAPPISEQHVLRLIERKNRGIGFLENGRYDEAAEIFEILITELPDDPLAVRNLAIARVLRVEELTIEDAAQRPELVEKQRKLAKAAVEAAVKAEPKSASPLVCAARLSKHLAEIAIDGTDDQKKEISSLEAAVKRNARIPHIWFELYEAYSLQRDERSKDAAASALKRAYQLRKDNAALVVEWLKSQAFANDPEVVATLESARGIVSLVGARLKKEHSAYDLPKMLDDAIVAAKAGKPEAQAAIAGLANVLNGQNITRLDRRRLRPFLLEFVRLDFGEEFYKQAQLPIREPAPAIAVKLISTDGEMQRPDLPGTTAMSLVDVDLDGRVDLVVVRDRRLEAYGFSAAKRGWRLLARADLPFAATGLMTVALNFDPVKQRQAVLPKEDVKKPNTSKKPNEIDRDEGCATAAVDFVTWGPGGIAVVQNNIDKQTGQPKLVALPPGEMARLKDVITVTAADFDHDSDLDLIVSTKTGISLWTNQGDLAFTSVTASSELPPAGIPSTSLTPIDFDRNVLIDVVLGGSELQDAGYLQNIGHGQLRYRKFEAEFKALAGARSLLPIEADGNASWDWIAAGPKGTSLTLTRTVEPGRCVVLRSTILDKTAVDGARLWDYDNDGFQDVLAWSENGLLVLRGKPNGEFEKVDGLFSDDIKKVSTLEIADLDGDGDLDVVALSAGKPVAFDNDGGNANAWIDISLHAQNIVQFPEQRCNMHGVGSLVELKAGTEYQARVVTGPTMHFGLGTRKTADVLRVIWTNGIPQNVLAPKSRQSICSQQELLKGSCPFLYTWNGQRYEFVTDLLWAAPIGLQLADGVIAPSREWEYLKIDGDKLAPVDGEYRLHITEELWEAGYFDSVKLFAIDHPADTEIFSNEKVGPADIAAFKVHTVRKPRLPVAARDQIGRDVLPVVANRDGRYLQAYTRRLTQGLTPEHFLELDLGKLDKPKNIRLFLTGWVFPSDTSINVWLSQNPNMAAPQPPSVWVPDKHGRWTKTVPYMGFPGGKTKTIVVDLSKAFLTDDYRLQIRTTMELRWDSVYFTVNEEPADFRMTELPLKHAELSYRGFSKRINRPHHAPESYNFGKADPSPHWPPMAGKFTRYGDVTELVKSDDDRLAVMGSGDTMLLRFGQIPATKSLPPGWKRDFIIRNVGWDKDADLNTVLGQTVEPLPYRAMSRYPFAPTDKPPDSEEFRKYLRRYQTRQQPAADFWRMIERKH